MKLDARGVTDRLVQAFTMTNYLVWVFAAMAVFVPWRPFARLFCACLRRRRNRGRELLRRLMRYTDVSITIGFLMICGTLTGIFHRGLITRVGSLTTVRTTLANSTLCQASPEGKGPGFFVDEPYIAACIASYALVKVFVVVRMAMASSVSIRKRFVATAPLVVLWETAHRAMGHALVVALVDSVDEVGVQLERLQRLTSAPHSVVTSTRFVRQHVFRPLMLLLQLACGTIAFGSSCADDVGGASLSLVFSTTSLAFNVVRATIVCCLTVSTLVLRLHIKAAHSGWQAGMDVHEAEGEEGEEGKGMVTARVKEE